MKQHTINLLIIMLCLTNPFFSQSQTNESSVDITPHWEKDETHSVKIKTTTTDLNADNGKTQTYVSTFDAKFKLLDASDTGYRVEWTYINSTLAENEPVIESQIVAKLTNVKMIIKLSEVGRFVELLNANEVKAAADKAIDELIAKSISNPTMHVQYQSAKKLISSKLGLEIAVLKQIKFYHFSFGFNYKLDFIQKNNIKIPNPLGGEAFNAVEKVQLTKLDNANSICVIETSKTIESNAVKTAVSNYIKNLSNADAKRVAEEMEKVDLEISESTMQQLDFSKGLVQKSFFKRTINLGFQNRTTYLQVATDD